MRSRTATSMRRVRPVTVSSSAPSTDTDSKPATENNQALLLRVPAISLAVAKWLRVRSSSQPATNTIIAASSMVTSVSVRPTVQRRGSHSLRGRPISVSAIGAAIAVPSESPTHHVSQLNGSCAVVTTLVTPSALVATDALIRHAANAPSAKNIATSRGSDKVSGCRTKRLTSAAPASACSIAPIAINAGSAKLVPLGFSHALTQNAPRAPFVSRWPRAFMARNTGSSAA